MPSSRTASSSAGISGRVYGQFIFFEPICNWTLLTYFRALVVVLTATVNVLGKAGMHGIQVGLPHLVAFFGLRKMRALSLH